MRLLDEVVAVLQGAGIPHALIGAAAMAIHGVSRATADIDLLTVDERTLRKELWAGLEAGGARVLLLRGDHDDPLAGNVRLARAGDRSIDVVVGRHAWQQEIIQAARPSPIGGATVDVVTPAGLVLLKLHAGGPRDAWDIRMLLETLDEAKPIAAEVERMLPRLPVECKILWDRIREGR